MTLGRARELLSEIGHKLSSEIQDAATSAFHAQFFHEPISTIKSLTRSAVNEIFVPHLEFTDQQTEHPKIDKGGDYKQVLFVDGRPRQYTLHVPEGYKPKDALPLVVALHGHGENADQFAAMTKMSEKADQAKFIVAYPDATEWLGAKTLTAWDTKNGLVPPGIKTDDVGFVKSVIDTTKEQVSVDPKRVYLAGYSNGGMLTYLAGTELAKDVAAIAVVSGAMSGKEKQPDSPVSVLSIHGEEDCLVPLDGRRMADPIEKLGVPEFRSDDYANSFWTTANSIDADPTTSKEGDVVKIKYTNPKNGTDVIQETIENGKHYWPEQYPGDPKKSTTDEIWNFFQAHAKAQLRSA